MFHHWRSTSESGYSDTITSPPPAEQVQNHSELTHAKMGNINFVADDTMGYNNNVYNYQWNLWGNSGNRSVTGNDMASSFLNLNDIYKRPMNLDEKVNTVDDNKYSEVKTATVERSLEDWLMSGLQLNEGDSMYSANMSPRQPFIPTPSSPDDPKRLHVSNIPFIPTP